MSTHATRNTTTGLVFENSVSIRSTGIDVSKQKFVKYMKARGINPTTIVSRMLYPDEAYFDEKNHSLVIFEKKYQQTEGSADEKPQTCGFKISQFKKLGKAIGATNVKYIYIFNDWFKAPKYKDMLDYIRSVPDCDYIFDDEVDKYGN